MTTVRNGMLLAMPLAAAVGLAAGCDSILELNAYYLREGGSGGTGGSGSTGGSGGSSTCSGTDPLGSTCSPQACQCAPTPDNNAYCVDDRCCDEGCGGVCVSCANDAGHCLPLPIGSPDACTDNEVCDGLGTCFWSLDQLQNKLLAQVATAIDADGELVAIAGTYFGDPGYFDLPAADADGDIFVAVLNGSGDVVNSVRIEATNTRRVSGVALAGQTVYVTGTIGPFGMITGVGGPASDDDVFVLRVTSDKSYGGVLLVYPDNQKSNAIDVQAGEIVVAGGYAGDPQWPPGCSTGVNPGNSANAFVLKFDNNWGCSSLGFGTSGEDRANAVSFDNDGNIVVGATIAEGTFDFDAVTIGVASGEGPDVLVAKLSASSLERIWVTQVGSTASDDIHDLDIDANNRVVLTGNYAGPSIRARRDGGTPVDLTNIAPVSHAYGNPVILALDPTGDTDVSRGFSIAGSSQSATVRVDTAVDGTVNLGGLFDGTLSYFGDSVTAGIAPRTLFVARLNDALDQSLMLRHHDLTPDLDALDTIIGIPVDVTVDSSGSTYLGGAFTGSLRLQTATTALQASEYDIFLLEYAP